MARRRRSTTARGYGARHQALRRVWSAYVRDGTVHCARCGKVIDPDDEWHLDHADDRSSYLGPSHQACNIGARNRRGPVDPDPRPATKW